MDDKYNHVFTSKKTLYQQGLILFFVVFCLNFNSFHTLYANQTDITDYKFVHLGIEDGLISNSISCIYQDRNGLIWIGTYHGVSKYDGYSFTHFRSVPGQENSLPGNKVNSIIEDANGDLIIATNKGLVKIDYSTEKIIKPLSIEEIPEDILNGTISTLYLDEQNRLWIGANQGLYVFNYQTSSLQRISFFEMEKKDSIHHGAITCIIKGHSYDVWVGTEYGGLFRIFKQNSQKYSVEHFKHALNDVTAISTNAIYCGLQDNKGNLWFGTTNGGMFKYLPQSNSFKTFQPKLNENSISSMTINDLEQDKFGNIWIGTRGVGIDILDPSTMHFYHLSHIPGEKSSIGWNVINHIYRDHSGSMWVGTYGKGVDVWHRSLQQFKTISKSGLHEEGIEIESVITISLDIDERIWIGGHDGFDIIDRETGEFIRGFEKSNIDINIIRDFEIDADNPEFMWIALKNGPDNLVKMHTRTLHARKFAFKGDIEQSDNRAYSLLDDGNGNLFIGTNIGLYQFKKKSEEVILIDTLFSGVEFGQFISQVFIDSKNRFWVGTARNGLYLLDFPTKTYKLFVDSEGTISNNAIFAINEDSDGEIWVGTDLGLNKYLPDSSKFALVNTDQEGINKSVYGILEGVERDLWISKNDGLVKMNLEDESLKFFYEINGLQNDNFNPYSYFKSPSGEMFFGGINGLNSFYPDEIYLNNNAPKIIVSDFKIFNESVPIGEWRDGKVILNKTLSETTTIKLSHSENVFSFYFSVLDFEIPERNSYAYMMDGFEKDWNYVGNRRFAHYTSLKPGKYTFRVRGANCDGFWNNDGVSIKLIITPPFYSAWWFKVIAILLVVFSVVFIYRKRVNAIKRQKRILEDTVKIRTSELNTVNKSLLEKQEEISSQQELLMLNNQELEDHKSSLEEQVSSRTRQLEIAKEKAEESDKLKSAFLANMSHEIRTPMNAILGFSNLLGDRDMSDDDKKECISLIRVNGDALVKLIDDIIDYSRIQSNQLILSKTTFDLDNLLLDVYKSFSLNSDRMDKGINFNLDKGKGVSIKSDKQRVRQVLVNLIANAFKYTEKGRIMFGYTLAENDDVIFYVHDTGIGIPKDREEFVFQRFGKIENKKVGVFRGVGLGLSISKSIVEKLGGKIWFKSKPEKGSSFYFTIPHYSGHISGMNTIKTNQIFPSSDFTGYKVLIAEDEPTNYRYLEKILQKTSISIEWAENGAVAMSHFEQNKACEFDLVLMDIKMPLVNGEDAFKHIKRIHPELPIIAQTAYAMVDEVSNLFQLGFDAVLTKPIDRAKLIDTLQQFLPKKS